MKTTLLHLSAFSFLALLFCFNNNWFLDEKEPNQQISIIQKPILPAKIDFNLHVKPIISDRCFKCHGPDKNKVEAGLQLTTFEGATARLKSGKRAIIPFKPYESEFVKRILTKDADDMMPDPKSNLSLTETEKAILIKWIEQGAEYKEHWSFVPPTNYPIPTNKITWGNNAIDSFVLQKLDEKGLTPAKEASKETLIRRLSLDLTGLPPTVEQVNEYVKDTKPDAYERLVDRLMDSPQYGERMALDWLDVARYADTHGFQDDGLRNAYPYRDWLIQSFNQNLPFDKFSTWQLAGDLLPNPTKDQLIATCFNRNHQQSQEGGIVDEEYRVEYVADRVNTFGKVFLGLTTECARCHTHKYDPITHTDYYSLFAFFNQNNDTGQIPYSGEASPTLILNTPEAEKSLDKIKASMMPYETKTKDFVQYEKDLLTWIKNLKPEEKQSLSTPVKRVVHIDFEQADTTMLRDYLSPPSKKELERRAKAFEEAKKKDPNKKPGLPGKTAGFWNVEKADTMLRAATYNGDKDKRPLATVGKIGNGISFRGDAGLELGKVVDYDRHQPFSSSIWFKLLKEGESGPIMNKSNGDAEGFRGWLCKLNKNGTLSFQINHVWPANSIDFRTLDKIKVDEWTHIVLTYDGSSKAAGVRFWINGVLPKSKLMTDNLQKSILRTRNEGNKSSQPFMIGTGSGQTAQNSEMDEFQLFKRQISEIEVQELFRNKPLIADLIYKTNRSESEEKQLLEAYLLRGYNPIFSESLDSLTKLRKQENEILTEQEEIMTMHDRAEYRPTFVLNRGAYDAPTKEQVFPRTPTKFSSFEGYPKNRLGLSKWLLADSNPLFARVAANRYWQLLFGRGIVATQEDFGNQGALPTHPELLDYLALDFRKNGWDVKRYLKQLVMSATYRQSSVPSAQAKESDALNEFYSHYPAHRISAELVRDNALAASGLLVKNIGGPSVKPYQPAGLWEALATRNATKYVQNHGDSLYRRSMYTIWKRSSPPPSMLNFDATDRAFCIVRRQKTASPLQALVLMNDPQFIEASRVLAEKMIQSSANVEERLIYGFEALISRKPRPEELSELVKLVEKQKKHFSENKENAEMLLRVGEYPRNKSLDAVEVAAYSIVASMVMNFDEFVVKR